MIFEIENSLCTETGYGFGWGSGNGYGSGDGFGSGWGWGAGWGNGKGDKFGNYIEVI